MHLAGIHIGIGQLVAHDADILHALDGDVVQILASQGIGMIGVPTGGHCGKHLDVVFAHLGIEEQCVANGLEEGKVR